MTKYQKILLTYKIYYVIYLLVAFNAFLNERSWFPYLTYLTAGWGAIMILVSLPRLKSFFQDKVFICLVLFIGTWALTSLLHRQYGLMENIQGIIWLTIQTVVLYGASKEFSITDTKKELNIIASIYIFVCSIFNIISISMLKWGYLYELANNKTKEVRAIGFRIARLWGIYDDPNHGAVISLVAFFFALYLFHNGKKIIQKVIFIISLIIQGLYIILSDSRTAFIGLIVGLSIYVFGYSMHYFSDKRKNSKTILSIATTITSVVLISAITIAGWQIEEKIFLAHQKTSISQNNVKNSKDQSEKPQQSERKKEVSSDITSGRLAIWQDGITIFKDNKILGIGQRNMPEYAVKNMPKSYIVENEAGVKYDSLHNMPLDVLLSQGIVGMLLLLIIIGLVLQKLIKKANKVYLTDKNLYYTLFAILVSTVTCSMFISMIFYVQTPATYMFWLCLGYFTNLLNKAGKR